MSEAFGITVENSAVARINALRQKQNLGTSHYLRIAVTGGGCSGYQYEMTMDPSVRDGDDLVFEDAIVIDQVSRKIMCNSVISFKDDLMGSQFVIDNPNAVSSCGCGTSFSLKE